MKKELYNIIKHSEVSEKSIESYLVKQVKKLGGICLKYSSPIITGYPDRIILLPDGWTVWIELKSKGKHTSPIQKARIKQMQELGHAVYVCDNKPDIDKILKKYTK